MIPLFRNPLAGRETWSGIAAAPSMEPVSRAKPFTNEGVHVKHNYTGQQVSRQLERPSLPTKAMRAYQ